MRGRLARSSLQTGALLGLRVITQAGVLVLLTRLLGPQLYGRFVAIASLAILLGVLPSLGAGFVMLARSVRDEASAADTWRYAWPMTAMLGVLLLGVYMGVARFITVPSLPLHIVLTLGTAELMMTPFTMLLSYALQSSDRVPLSQYVQWLPLGLRVLAVIPCFAFADAERLSAYVALQFAASLLGLLLGLRVTLRYVALDWRPRLPTRKEIRDGASYAVMHLVSANPSELDKVIAARAVGGHDAGIYSATARVMSAAVMPVVAMLLAAQPRLFRHAYDPSREGYRLVGLIAIIALGWGIASGVILALCSPLLPLLFGTPFAATARLMPWLAAVAPFLSLRLVAGTVLVTLGKPLERIGFEACGILILIVTMLTLAPPYGVRGLAIALIVSEASMSAIGWWLVRHQLLKQSVALAKDASSEPMIIRPRP